MTDELRPLLPLSLDEIDVYILNLDESRYRWIQCFRRLSQIFNCNRIHRVPAIDGRTLSQSNDKKSWRADALQRLQREGYLADAPIPDPIRTALCLTHQRALRQFLGGLPLEDEEHHWALVLEDDARPAEALLLHPAETLSVPVPPDAELLFLHDRVLTGTSAVNSNPYQNESSASASTKWRKVLGGIGLEAYLVSPAGARKMLQAWKPLHFECDIQLMTFAEHYSDQPTRQEIWHTLNKGIKNSDPHASPPDLLQCYAPERPLFQIDETLPSVKLQFLNELPSPSQDISDSNPHQTAVPSLTLNHRHPLAFATCWFNPSHYRSRLDNFLRFQDQMQDTNLLVVELAFGEDDWQLPDDTPNLVRLRSSTICWQKEALLNHGLSLLQSYHFPYLGWLDADILFQTQDWQQHLIEALQTKRLCQVFETVSTTFPDRGPQVVPGVAASWIKHAHHPIHCHMPGFGWAMHREVWQNARLFDLNILGGGDGAMWRAAFQDYVDESLLFQPHQYSKDFMLARQTWAKNWSSSVALRIGYANGVRLTSLPHGHMKHRHYDTRQRKLIRHVYSPSNHLERDPYGLLQWRSDAPEPLKREVAEYFINRREDHLS